MSDRENDVISVLCDGRTQKLTTYSRSTGIQYYLNQVLKVITGKPINREGRHVVLVTTVERDIETDEVIRTYHSGLFPCPHDQEEEYPNGEHRQS